MRPVANESKIPPGILLVGKYRVTREIGRGGMAAVYEAEHTSLGKKVAVKVLAQELSASTIVIERFFREARAAASVKSPHIVDIYDSGRLEDGRPFICMEMLEGESLYDRMARIRLIDPETTVRIITHCAKGLMKAHAAGIVHRDLKPENIFITKSEDGEEIAKILDFGLAKFYAPVATDQKAARLTREGAVFGTPAYMSPEQVKGQGSVDHRSDLWALGCMAFECLIGRPVWNTDQGVAMTFAAIATSPVPTPSKLRPDLPGSFDDWFKHALEREPENRFQTAKELAEALQRAFGSPSRSMVASQDFNDPRTGPQRLDSNPLDLPQSRRRSPDSGGLPDDTVPSTPLIGMPPSFPSDPSSSPHIGHVPSDRSPRPMNLSANEMPPMARSSQVSSQAMPQPPSVLRWVLSSVALVAASVVAFIVYANVLRPQVFVPVVQSTATMPSAKPSAGTVETQPPVDEPKWATALAEGQKLFSSGDAPGALKRFKDAQDMGGGAVAHAYTEQVKAAQSGTGACKEVAFGHPRTGVPGGIGRPTVATVGKGALVSWTDDHEQAGHDHAYGVLVDETGHAISPVRDLTPEGTEVVRPSLLTVGDRAALLYWDKSGREAGVHVRWIDAEGRIGGSSVLVGAARPGSFWPAMDRAPDGFYVAWQDDRDREGDDIFFRKLSNDLEPEGNEIRATDYIGISGHFVNARVPAVAVASNTLFIAYKLEREPLHVIYRMRLALNGPETTKGLDERTTGSPAPAPPRGKPSSNIDRELGDVVVVNEDKAPGDAPAIACGREGCFVAWHGERGGAFASLIEPAEGKVLWRKRLADKGSHPSLGVGADGTVAVTYFEGGRVKLANLTRDGVGQVSVLGRVTGDQPRPWLTAGRVKGEWYLAWQDTEAAHSEAYVGRVVCAAR